MSVKFWFIVPTIVGVLILAPAVSAYAATQADHAAEDVAQHDLSAIDDAQTLALGVTGYASSVGELNEIISTVFGARLSPRADREVIVVATNDGSHYIAASKLSSGTMLVKGDEHRTAISCSGYTPNCISLLTADPYLINAKPAWVKF